MLDIFVRRGAGQPQELGPQVELLRKIGDTLGVLGLGELRGTVQTQTEKLEKIVAGSLQRRRGDAGRDRRRAHRCRGPARRRPGRHDPAEERATPRSEHGEDHDFQQVQSAVLRECILNLARIKESVAQSVGGTLDAAGPRQLAGADPRPEGRRC